MINNNDSNKKRRRTSVRDVVATSMDVCSVFMAVIGTPIDKIIQHNIDLNSRNSSAQTRNISAENECGSGTLDKKRGEHAVKDIRELADQYSTAKEKQLDQQQRQARSMMDAGRQSSTVQPARSEKRQRKRDFR